MSFTSPWLAFIAVVWAALFNPAQSQQRFVAGMLDGIDLPAAVVSLDRHSWSVSNDRRRAEPTHDGNPPTLAIAATELSAPGIVAAERFITSIRGPVATPARSPAQPRAPPASAHAG